VSPFGGLWDGKVEGSRTLPQAGEEGSGDARQTGQDAGVLPDAATAAAAMQALETTESYTAHCTQSKLALQRMAASSPASMRAATHFKSRGRPSLAAAAAAWPP
jgi:hypothetical protein